jgi:hypothetical protein
VRSAGNGGSAGGRAATTKGRIASRSRGSSDRTRDASPGLKRGPVRPGLTESVPHVGDGEQAGSLVQLAPLTPAGYPDPSVRSWRLATRPSGASTGERARIRPEWYGCRRTRSLSSGRSVPGGSHTPVGTATRPRSCTKPARRTRAGSADPRRLAPGRRVPQHPRRVAVEPRRLEVGGVAEPGEGVVEGSPVVERASRDRLGVDDRLPQVLGFRTLQELRGRLEEDRGDRRVERPSGPSSHRLAGGSCATDDVEHDGAVRHRGEPSTPTTRSRSTPRPTRSPTLRPSYPDPDLVEVGNADRRTAFCRTSGCRRRGVTGRTAPRFPRISWTAEGFGTRSSGSRRRSSTARQ